VALGAHGLRLLHGIDERLDVLDEFIFRERGLADASLNDAGLLDAGPLRVRLPSGEIG
jgi:hypothetical protein